MGLLGIKWDQDVDAASFGMKALQGGGTVGPKRLQNPSLVLQSWHLAAVKQK